MQLAKHNGECPVPSHPSGGENCAGQSAARVAETSTSLSPPPQRSPCAGIAAGITFLMQLMCEGTETTRLALVDKAKGLQGRQRALLGPDPLALHFFAGKPAPIETTWGLLSDFILCASEPAESEIVQSFREMEGEEAVENFALAGLKGAEMIGHIQALNARARLGTVSSYLEASHHCATASPRQAQPAASVSLLRGSDAGPITPFSRRNGTDAGAHSFGSAHVRHLRARAVRGPRERTEGACWQSDPPVPSSFL